jgi:lipoprotein signal peptidase
VALSTLALKWFFLATALGLIVSTCLGLWMGLKYSRNKVLALVLLCAGAVAPVLILML